jgi:hypothetical protein
MTRVSKPVLYLAIAALMVIGYLLATPPSTAKRSPKKTTTVRKPAASSIYTDADRSANFTDKILVSRDAFQPLVVRKSAALSEALAASGVIPPEFAGGDPNWICTGTAEVDGVRQVLLENKSTSEGVFLRVGERWKSSVVSDVGEDSATLVGPGGIAKTIHVQQEQGADSGESVEEMMPVQPNLNGVIGGGRAPAGQVSPMPNLPLPTAAPQAEENNGD